MNALAMIKECGKHQLPDNIPAPPLDYRPNETDPVIQSFFPASDTGRADAVALSCEDVG